MTYLTNKVERVNKPVTLTLDDETLRKLDELAVEDEGNRSRTVRRLVREMYRNRIKKLDKDYETSRLPR
jgi:metal-responsive CopG/Arc/MetJ family transcriptional regulator